MLTIHVSDDCHLLINRMQRRCGCVNAVDVIAKSLAIYETLLNHRDSGLSIESVGPETGESTTIDLLCD